MNKNSFSHPTRSRRDGNNKTTLKITMLRRRVRPAYREGYQQTSKRETRARKSRRTNKRTQHTMQINGTDKARKQDRRTIRRSAKVSHNYFFFSCVPEYWFSFMEEPEKVFHLCSGYFLARFFTSLLLEMLVSRVNSLIKMHWTSSFWLRASCSECLATSPTIVRNSDDWFY